MTPNAPTWADVESFLQADGWREIPGHGTKHIFFEKILMDGRVLQTHISHSRQKSMSTGRFRDIMRYDLEVSRAEFWQAIQTGAPVERPVPVEPVAAPEHPAWVVAVLLGLGVTAQQLETLPVADGQRIVQEHWAGLSPNDVRHAIAAAAAGPPAEP